MNERVVWNERKRLPAEVKELDVDEKTLQKVQKRMR